MPSQLISHTPSPGNGISTGNSLISSPDLDSPQKFSLDWYLFLNGCLQITLLQSYFWYYTSLCVGLWLCILRVSKLKFPSHFVRYSHLDTMLFQTFYLRKWSTTNWQYIIQLIKNVFNFLKTCVLCMWQLIPHFRVLVNSSKIPEYQWHFFQKGQICWFYLQWISCIVHYCYSVVFIFDMISGQTTRVCQSKYTISLL